MIVRPISALVRATLCSFGLALVLAVAGMPAAAQSSYRLQPGDVLQIEVLEDASLNRSALVLPDGTISFPFMGTVRAQGRSVDQVRQSLTTGLAPNFAAEPTVVVSVATLAPQRPRQEVEEETIDVYIMGEVVTPGKAEVVPGTTILQFLAEAGGVTPFAAKSRIELHRTDPSTQSVGVYLFSYDGRGKGHRISPGTQLFPGDVIVVPPRGLFE